MEQLPTFKDTPSGERQELFIKKLELCSTVTDFAEIDNRDKELKRLNLLEIMDYINQTKGVFNEQTFPHITKMISNNLFRGLAPNNMPAHMQYDPEEDEPVLEVSWPHLQYVYEFLLRFVVSNETDPKVVKRYIDTSFLVKLLDLFDSEDPRERDYLKTILHRIYGKFMPYRAFIRKSINNIFYRFIYITERHNGIAELLEILGSIINGFALPLKEEHKQFLMKALLPLHKVRYVGMYHQQLSYCVTQFVEKDPKLSEQVLKTILDYWPRTYSPKEVLFLNEVEEILEMVQAEPFEALVDKLFERIALCIGSPHFQVAERALFLWNNEYIVSLIMQQRAKILPLVFGALYENSRQHWNTTVHGLTCNVVKLFMEMDGKLFDDCSADYRRETEEAEGKARKVTQMWEDIDRLAESSSLFKDPKIKEQLMPISPSLKPRTTSVLSEGDVSFDGMETKSFEELTASNKDGLRRKSMMPSNKKAES
mmetsp:Transcript_33673/g.83953  ORF Transcript_33673/g.83953 Transcript_33673/m.83953 type:complete len:482 (-) Transcript_33673:669-2114(-)